MVVQSFKVRRIKRLMRRSFLAILGLSVFISSIIIFSQNYHFYLMNRLYNLFIETTLLLDFRLKKVTIYGAGEHLLNIPYKIGSPLWTYNVSVLKDQISAVLPIRYVSVHKCYPHELQITVQKRVPIAQVLRKGRYSLMDEEGVLYASSSNRDALLPLVEGNEESVSKKFPELIEILKNFPDVQKNIEMYRLIKKGRWDLILKDASVIMLPREQIDEALRYYRNMKKKSYRTVDLRVKGYIFMKDHPHNSE